MSLSNTNINNGCNLSIQKNSHIKQQNKKEIISNNNYNNKNNNIRINYEIFEGYISRKSNCVIVRNCNLYNKGCYGKGHYSRSKPIQFGGKRSLSINIEEIKKENEMLILSYFEAFYILFCYGNLNIYDNENNENNEEKKSLSILECWNLFKKINPFFIYKYIAYHYFRSKGWVVRSGIKFGADFVAYKLSPTLGHAQFCILVRKNGQICTWKDLTNNCRINVTVSKDLIICIVYLPTNPVFFLNPFNCLKNSKVTTFLMKRKKV